MAKPALNKRWALSPPLDLDPQFGIDLEKELAETLQREIRRETVREAAPKMEQEAHEQGKYLFVIPVVVDPPPEPPVIDILKWLSANVPDRFEFKHYPEDFCYVVDFGEDKEAAALFKLFWR